MISTKGRNSEGGYLCLVRVQSAPVLIATHQGGVPGNASWCCFGYVHFVVRLAITDSLALLEAASRQGFQRIKTGIDIVARPIRGSRSLIPQ